MPEYLILSIYKSGKYYKPVIRAQFKGNKQMKVYKFFTASEQGFSERGKAQDFGLQMLKAGKFL